MKSVRNLIVVLSVLVISGFARLPMDNKTARDLRAQDLLPDPISLDTREQLGQTSLAIALGGLRSLIASMLNLQAHNRFENQEWYELERDYQTIVALQPRTRYYWEVASWHLRSNAYADYDDKPGMTEGLRKRHQRQVFEKGIAFLERGLEHNPQDWRLWAAYGSAYSEIWRPKNLTRATEAFKTAFKLGGRFQHQRFHVYCLCRLPGRQEETWKFAKAMWEVPINRKHRTPRHIFFAMQNWADPPASERWTLEQIYGSRLQALAEIPDYWFRQNQGFPVYGLRSTLEELGEEFQVPPELHPLRFDPEKTFRISPISGKPYRYRSGAPRSVPWRTIWMTEVRSDFLKALRRFLRPKVSLDTDSGGSYSFPSSARKANPCVLPSLATSMPTWKP